MSIMAKHREDFRQIKEGVIAEIAGAIFDALIMAPLIWLVWNGIARRIDLRLVTWFTVVLVLWLIRLGQMVWRRTDIE